MTTASHPPTVDDATPAPTLQELAAAVFPNSRSMTSAEQAEFDAASWADSEPLDLAPRLPEGSTEPEPATDLVKNVVRAARRWGIIQSSYTASFDDVRAVEVETETAADALESALTLAHSEIETLREAVKVVTARVGCGDHSCLFVKPRGMGTNGGCRCARRPGVTEALAQFYRAALRTLTTETDT